MKAKWLNHKYVVAPVQKRFKRKAKRSGVRYSFVNELPLFKNKLKFFHFVLLNSSLATRFTKKITKEKIKIP